MEPAEKQMFTKIALMDMFKDGVIDEYNLIDISTEAAFNSFFSPLLDGSNQIDEKTKKWIWQTRKHSSKCQELMFCWRGKLCPSYAIIITPPPDCSSACNLYNVLRLIRGDEEWGLGDKCVRDAAVKEWRNVYMALTGRVYIAPPEKVATTLRIEL